MEVIMKNFTIYSRMNSVNVPALTKIAKASDWPKGKRYTVNCNGVEIKVQTYLAKAEEKMPAYGYDAYAAIDSMFVRELRQEEILWVTNGEKQYAEPRFNIDELTKLNDEQLEERKAFMVAIANLINNQETMEAIVQAAAKKKNGTLHKNRIVRIACSGVADSYNRVYAIVARAKTDTTMAITFEGVLCKPGDNEVWVNDFVSTYQQGLLVSEALKEIM